MKFGLGTLLYKTILQIKIIEIYQYCINMTCKLKSEESFKIINIRQNMRKPLTVPNPRSKNIKYTR